MPDFFSTRSTGSNEAYPSAPADKPKKEGASNAAESSAASRPKIPGRPVRQKYLSGQPKTPAEKEEPTTQAGVKEDEKPAAPTAEPKEKARTVKVSSDLVSMPPAAPRGGEPTAPPASSASDPAAVPTAGEGATGASRPVRKERDPASTSPVAVRRPTVRMHLSQSPASPPAVTPTASLSPRVEVPPPAAPPTQGKKPQSTSIQPPSPRIVRHAATPPPPPPGTVRSSPAKPSTGAGGGFTPSRATMFLTREFSSVRISRSAARASEATAAPKEPGNVAAAPENPESPRASETETPVAGAASAPMPTPSSPAAADRVSPATTEAQTAEAGPVAATDRPEIEQSVPPAPDVAPEPAAAPPAAESSIPSLMLPTTPSSPTPPSATAPEEPSSNPTTEAADDPASAAIPQVETTPVGAAAAPAAAAPRATISEESAPVTPLASAAPAEPAPVRAEKTIIFAEPRRPDPTPGLPSAAAPSVLAQVTFSFEVFALELTAGFKIAAVEARPSSEAVSLLLGAESKNLVMLAAAISFSVESCRTSDDGKLQALTLTPLTQMVPPVNPSLGLKVGVTTLPTADSTRRGTAPIAIAAGSPQPVQIHASCRVVGLDFNPRFEIERLHLELETQSVYVQLDPASAHLSGNPPPTFTIAFAGVSADASPVAQLRLTPGAGS